MKVFRLPDLGEGLPDAVIRQWHVREGDSIAADQALVTVETAKALVEVPAPWGGSVEKLFAGEGDTLETGQPLVGFKDRTGSAEPAPSQPGDASAGQPPTDSGTVVGRIDQGSEQLHAESRPIRIRPRNATPAVRALARQLRVDLAGLHPAGARFTEAEVRAAAPRTSSKPPEPQTSKRPVPTNTGNTEPARRAMALAMSRARDLVCPMTLCDEADISKWPKGEPATLRLLRAIAAAAAEVPNLNAHFVDDALAPQSPVNIGLAVDAPKGLFVPVLKDVDSHSDEQLLDAVRSFRKQAMAGAIPQPDLQGATIHLSNFGSLGGRFATPVVVPPLVCIVGAGRSHEAVLPHKGKAKIRRLLPLSITADHRAVTGGELARFLAALKNHLTQA
ncbi:dihydrolipoamide acetyltransferase family protein [Microbulbifer bruguierae]|uniref:Dihydrolipoamide acetyltransferase component of pyruvate dehydrogenase complex n=1 Tax=Microbulbifer bruguierae TaxID=3029061 RepID=A0ABY8N909_9GAMM|nr:dihydrolipoamide acetyltransferase family protein [Microbulbifer bruguierae]WGL15390.1 dihydrolipoamide acetyltransferase family protein [Microbulbifer bruguierae]